MSGGVEMARTTFYRHKCAIEDIFGIYIDCDKKNGSEYYIGNDYVLNEDSVQNWMLSTLSVGNIVEESQGLHHRILLENIPSGDARLQQVINAMKENRYVMISYQRYTAPSANSFTLAPYCIKLFRQRWYVLGLLSNGYLATFSFDRILDISLTNDKYKIPKDFDAADYFRDSFGIVVDDKATVERVVLRTYGYERYNLHDLPLHPSQREIGSTEDYTDYELHLKITSDFMSKLLSRGEWLEILEPKSLADEIVEWHQNAINRYKK
jgi:predicted DNA-binding transcriptional regulator YafY